MKYYKIDYPNGIWNPVTMQDMLQDGLKDFDILRAMKNAQLQGVVWLTHNQTHYEIVSEKGV